jgi:hypothetical protein
LGTTKAAPAMLHHAPHERSTIANVASFFMTHPPRGAAVSGLILRNYLNDLTDNAVWRKYKEVFSGEGDILKH